MTTWSNTLQSQDKYYQQPCGNAELSSSPSNIQVNGSQLIWRRKIVLIVANVVSHLCMASDMLINSPWPLFECFFCFCTVRITADFNADSASDIYCLDRVYLLEVHFLCIIEMDRTACDLMLKHVEKIASFMVTGAFRWRSSSLAASTVSSHHHLHHHRRTEIQTASKNALFHKARFYRTFLKIWNRERSCLLICICWLTG